MINWIRRYKYYLIAALVVLLLVATKVARQQLHEVEVAEAQVGPLTLRLAASGLLEAESADLSFQGGGQVVEIYVREGDAVSQSDLLARLSPLMTTPETLGTAEVIHAPYDGTIVAIYQRIGSVVGPGQPVLRVVSAKPPWVTVFVESEDAVHLRPGQKLRCRAGGYLSQAWDLVVEEVGKEAVPRPDLPGSSRQVRVRCAVVNLACPLAPGTEVDVDGELLLAGNTLLIPTAAVVHEGTRDRVWIVQRNTVRRREIQVGVNNFDLIQVCQGLQAGDRVVVGGKQGLQEGQRVRVKLRPPISPGAIGGD